MIYIKLIENNEIDIKKTIFKNLKNRLRSKFIKIKEEKIDDKTVLTINDSDKRTLEKLSKYIDKNCITRVCLTNNLLKNKEFIDFMKNKNVKICDGKWLFKFLIPKVVEYICKCKKENLNYQEVSFLCDEISDVLVYNIRELSLKIKVLNIITNNEKKFKKIEKELYEQNGTILNINNNYKKSLQKSDIIFNFDFKEEEINKYNLPKKTCIINLSNEINIDSKSFEGININYFEIIMQRKYLKNSIYFNGFDNSILYESYIYKNTNPKNIKKEINLDNVNINFLYGINSKIRKSEYTKLCKIKN